MWNLIKLILLKFFNFYNLKWEWLFSHIKWIKLHFFINHMCQSYTCIKILIYVKKTTNFLYARYLEEAIGRHIIVLWTRRNKCFDCNFISGISIWIWQICGFSDFVDFNLILASCWYIRINASVQTVEALQIWELLDLKTERNPTLPCDQGSTNK